MRTPTAADILRIWERAGLLAPAEWALETLAAMFPEAPSAELERLSVGRRDAWLLRLHERCFGPRLTVIASCPGCGEELELDLATAQILALDDGAGDEVVEVAEGCFTARVRLPNALDMVATCRCASVAEARALLLARCTLAALREGSPCAPSDLPDALVAAIAAALDQLDPLAIVPYSLECPACGRGWAAILDIVPLLQAELGAAAEGLLQQVHTLASAYGWSEEAILALSPRRRNAYLERAR